MQIIRFSAPGRAGILGNPSDMYGGTVISCALPVRARCTLEPARRLSLQIGGLRLQPESLDPQNDAFDVLRVALLGLGYTIEHAKFNLLAESDIPSQAGLAGSTALLTAIIACLITYREGGWSSPHRLAETARQIEANALKVACGFQDQHMAVFGGLNYMDFRGKEGLQQGDDEPLATIESLNPYTLDLSTLPMWLAYTGISRHSGRVHTSLRSRWESGETAVIEGMTRIASLARRGKRALLERDWHQLAKLMNESYQIIRDLGGSGDALDQLVQTAMANGALGAKLAGAGGVGGTIIVLTLEPERTIAALRQHAQTILPLAPKAPGLFRY